MKVHVTALEQQSNKFLFYFLLHAFCVREKKKRQRGIEKNEGQQEILLKSTIIFRNMQKNVKIIGDAGFF